MGAVPAPAVAATASSKGWKLSVAQCVRLSSGRGRKANVLQRGDASRLYKEMHRQQVAVLYSGKVAVRTDPKPPFRDDRVVSLAEFCKYKSFAVSLRSNDANDWDARFEEWMTVAECDGPNDPRILPFHIFASSGSFQLDDLDERKRFQRSHRYRRSLQDGRRRSWSPPPPGARHGREPQTVRSLRLDGGFHWDVTTSRSPVMTSSDTIWKVPSHGYLNVYPDGFIRFGNHSTQTWSAKDSAVADAEDRRPRRRR